jgi:hypothetical protein
MSSPVKHPPPEQVQAAVDLGRTRAQRLELTQTYLSSQAQSDPLNQLAPEATKLLGARKTLLATLVTKSDIQAQADKNAADLVLADAAHDQAAREYAFGAAKLAKGDASLLATLGPRAAKKPKKGANKVVGAPTKLVVATGAAEGEAAPKCARVPGAGAYRFEYKLEPSLPADPWLPPGGITTKFARTTIPDLPPNQLIRARVCAIGETAGPWSEEVVGRAR